LPTEDVCTELTEGDISETVLNLVRHHEAWAPAIIFILAFGESLAFVSLLLPATAMLFGIGGMIGVADIAFWPIWCAAVLGAALGDWFSYWLGCRYSYAIARIWPLSRRPDLLPRGETFFRKWGTLSVFVGRFFGPFRSIMPLVAGTCGMRQVPFQIANITSAFIWATGVLTPGFVAIEWLL
jgi:membrane protein DedA with SNARE-associated domain